MGSKNPFGAPVCSLYCEKGRRDRALLEVWFKNTFDQIAKGPDLAIFGLLPRALENSTKAIRPREFLLTEICDHFVARPLQFIEPLQWRTDDLAAARCAVGLCEQVG